MAGNELAPFAVGRFIGVAEQLNDGDAIRYREQMLPGELHDGGELAPHGVKCGNFKDTGTSATESRASLYAFHPMKDVASVTMTLMGISMRVISDIVAFSLFRNDRGGALKGVEGICGAITQGKGNINYNPGGSARSGEGLRW